MLALPLAAQEPLPNLDEVPFPQVTVADPFFAPRRATNSAVTLRQALRLLEENGTLANFDLAAQGRRAGFKGYVYQDSDAYKAIEACAYGLAERADPGLDKQLDAIIARIAKAQQENGYLNTSYQINEPVGKRFTNLRDDQELYCAGHLFEAAVVHYLATDKRTLLNVAIRFADLLVATFGDGDGKRQGYCGYPEVELALVKLARATGTRSYVDLAHHFVRQRGSKFFATEHGTKLEDYDGSYWLDQVKLQDLTGMTGHAVRAAYLMSGAVDVAAITGDAELLKAARRVWRNTTSKNIFVTGGIGPSAANEGFTRDYDLPTYTAYQESCASIGTAMWAHRLNLLTGEAQYADAVETALYNAIPAGVQLDGTRFFYVNPLASRGGHHRTSWFGSACCPPNLARTFASVGSYAYATGTDSLYVNLFVQGKVRAAIGKEAMSLSVITDYPLDGTIELKVTEAPKSPVALHVRVPGWCTQVSILLNGEPVTLPADIRGNYCVLRRQWQAEDSVLLVYDMPVRTVEPDPRAEPLRGMVAFARGPMIYCAEQVDHDVPIDQIIAPPGTTLQPELRSNVLGGAMVLIGEMLDTGERRFTDKSLYRSQPNVKPVQVTLMPYALWDNRAPGAMSVWFAQAPRPPAVGGPEQIAKVQMSFQYGTCDPDGVRDGEEPRRSNDIPLRSCHWWNHLGGTEWIQYVWEQPQSLMGCRIFWFDDTGRGACRLPKSARLLWRDGNEWKPVQLEGELPIALDRWCEVRFAPVATTALRLEVDQQEGWASGVLEWRLQPAEDDR